MDTDLVAALRSRNVEVVTALEVGFSREKRRGTISLRGRARLRPLHLQCLRFLSASRTVDDLRSRTWWYDPGAATTILSRRAVAPDTASSLRDHYGGHAESSRVSQQLGLTTGHHHRPCLNACEGQHVLPLKQMDRVRAETSAL